MESLLVGSIVRGTLVLLAAFGLTALMRGASAAARHAVWSAALVGVIAIPLVSVALPWRMGVLPSGWGSPAVGERMPSPSVGSGTDSPSTPITWEAEPEGAAPGAGSPTSSVGIPSGEGALGPQAAAEADGPLSILASDPWRFALIAWLAIAALILGRIVIGMAWMWRLARRAEPLSGPAWLLPLGRVTQRLGLRTAVRVVRSDAAAMPVTCGVLRPAIVLPAESEEWTEERREAVLLHELAHVRRGDLVTHLIAWVACSLYWFHPLAWIAARRLRHESERACDDLVLGAGTRASEYASHLLDIVRTAGRGRAPAAAVPMAQKSSFEGRLLAILQPGVARQALTGRKKVAVAAGLALVVLPLAAMAPASPKRSTDAMAAVAEHEDAGSADPIRFDEPSALLLSTLDGMGPIRSGGPFQSSETQSHTDTDTDSQSGSEKTKVQANGRMVAALAGALRDLNPEVRASAAQALGSLADPRAVEALLEALRSDADPGVRKMAAWALGEIESPSAVGGLSQALRSDDSAEVRAASAWALGEIESAEAVDALGGALRDSSVEVRRNAVWALGQIESAEAVEWLVPALRDADVEIRRKAAWALGEIENPRAVTGLSAALDDSDAEVRGSAAWALGEIQDASAIPALRPLLHDPDGEVRKTAIWALLEMDDPAVYDVLVELLQDEDPEVRKQAAQGLGDM